MQTVAPEVVERAYDGLIQYGAIGCILVIVLSLSIGLVWWTLKTTATALREKDAYIQDVNDRRVESATKAVAATVDVSNKMKGVMDMLSRVITLLEAPQARVLGDGRREGSDDDS